MTEYFISLKQPQKLQPRMKFNYLFNFSVKEAKTAVEKIAGNQKMSPFPSLDNTTL
ncbi:hypothetical protein HS961_18520 [Comamonas piscis]|uniref:Uncharacterized protein n=1 Tax=Comamonas piscis TaxID=1562974 RepID=A0A7G5EKZ3_9BURK|nr:hypothetical protein [Comamonas piscis]QMV74668.1 hypothetical protein HS961_18520 [Comamonas piscis]WSO33132.1 hypothetical protein VUJ63_18580 [Comamonas piscis]